jgi:5-methylcytosine-specific restriction endonuclease McrA
MHTLLLNASYEPLTVISVHRAVVLVLTDKADLIAAGEGHIRSPSTSVPTPSVIRLRGFVRVPYRSALPLNRRNLLARDGHRCAYCTDRGDTVDHIVPRSRGGEHVWSNVVAACRRCNGHKGNRLLHELGWTLRTTPSTPRGWSWMLVGVGTTDPAWSEWLEPVRA